MSTETQIAAAMFLTPPALGFTGIVAEFEEMLRSHDSGRRSLVFDYDDIAMIEVSCLRIGLAWVAPDLPGMPYSLVIATGATDDAPAGAVDTGDCIHLREAILDRLSRILPCDTILRASFREALDSELLDRIAGSLQALNTFDSDTAANSPAPAAVTDAQTAATDTAPEAQPAQSAGFSRLRAAYQEALRQDQARRSVIWQAMMASANTLIETVNQGADLIRQVANTPDNPYGKLERQPRHDPMARYFDRFEKAEYELYGKLLD